MSRHIIIPPDFTLWNFAADEPLTVTDGPEKRIFDESKPASTRLYVLAFVMQDPQLAKDREARKAATAIRKAFHRAEPGQIVALEDAHWKVLKDVVEHPQRPLPFYCEQFEDSDEEIIEAKSKREEAERRLRERWPELVPKSPNGAGDKMPEEQAST